MYIDPETRKKVGNLLGVGPDGLVVNHEKNRMEFSYIFLTEKEAGNALSAVEEICDNPLDDVADYEPVNGGFKLFIHGADYDAIKDYVPADFDYTREHLTKAIEADKAVRSKSQDIANHINAEYAKNPAVFVYENKGDAIAAASAFNTEPGFNGAFRNVVMDKQPATYVEQNGKWHLKIDTDMITVGTGDKAVDIVTKGLADMRNVREKVNLKASHYDIVAANMLGVSGLTVKRENDEFIVNTDRYNDPQRTDIARQLNEVAPGAATIRNGKVHLNEVVFEYNFHALHNEMSDGPNLDKTIAPSRLTKLEMLKRSVNSFNADADLKELAQLPKNTATELATAREAAATVQGAYERTNKDLENAKAELAKTEAELKETQLARKSVEQQIATLKKAQEEKPVANAEIKPTEVASPDTKVILEAQAAAKKLKEEEAKKTKENPEASAEDKTKAGNKDTEEKTKAEAKAKADADAKSQAEKLAAAEKSMTELGEKEKAQQGRIKSLNEQTASLGKIVPDLLTRSQAATENFKKVEAANTAVTTIQKTIQEGYDNTKVNGFLKDTKAAIATSKEAAASNQALAKEVTAITRDVDHLRQLNDSKALKTLGVGAWLAAGNTSKDERVYIPADKGYATEKEAIDKAAELNRAFGFDKLDVGTGKDDDGFAVSKVRQDSGAAFHVSISPKRLEEFKGSEIIRQKEAMLAAASAPALASTDPKAVTELPSAPKTADEIAKIGTPTVTVGPTATAAAELKNAHPANPKATGAPAPAAGTTAAAATGTGTFAGTIADVGGSKEPEGDLVGDNRWGLMGLIGGGLLMALMGMDPIMMLLGAIAMLALGSFLGDGAGGFLGGMFGMQKAVNEKDITLEKDGPSPVRAQDKEIHVTKEGKITQNAAERDITLRGQLSHDKKEFVLERVVRADGQETPVTGKISGIVATKGKDGVTTYTLPHDTDLSEVVAKAKSIPADKFTAAKEYRSLSEFDANKDKKLDDNEYKAMLNAHDRNQDNKEGKGYTPIAKELEQEYAKLYAAGKVKADQQGHVEIDLSQPLTPTASPAAAAPATGVAAPSK